MAETTNRKQIHVNMNETHYNNLEWLRSVLGRSNREVVGEAIAIYHMLVSLAAHPNGEFVTVGDLLDTSSLRLKSESISAVLHNHRPSVEPHTPHTNHIGSEHFGYGVSMNSTGSVILTDPPNDRPSTELKSEGLSGIIMIDLEDWEKSLLDQKDQLDEDIQELESDLKSPAVVETIPHVQKQMMEDQLKTMIEYSEILNDRVAVSLSTKLYELMGIKEPINTHYT